MRGITSIEHVSGIGSTPARVNRRTGHLQINTDVFNRLKPEHQLFVLLHEEGHVALNTADEIAVDNYAFAKYAAQGHSLTEAVKALTQILNPQNPAHIQRAARQLQRAKDFDIKNNHNPQAHYIGLPNNNTMHFTESYTGQSNYDSLFGGKKAKAARQEKRKIKFDTRIERKKANSQQKILLAQHGVTKGGLFAKGLGGLISQAASVATGGAVDAGAMPDDAPPMQAPAANDLIRYATPPQQAEPVADIPKGIPTGVDMPGGLVAQMQPTTKSTTQNDLNPNTDMEQEQTTPNTFEIGGSLTNKKKNKALPYIIAGAVLLVIVLILAFKKK